jgi:hypothetical protein
MTALHFSRYTNLTPVLIAHIAGCGGSQPPIGAPGADVNRPVYQKPRSAAAKPGRNLLYASTHVGEVYVFNYPSGEYLNSLVPGTTDIGGLCTDTVGDVFVATRDGYEGIIYEYAHGGTSPVRTLSEYGYSAYTCAVDPTTGSLAVFSYAQVRMLLRSIPTPRAPRHITRCQT